MKLDKSNPRKGSVRDVLASGVNVLRLWVSFIVVIGVAVAALAILVPSVTSYFNDRQTIAALKAQLSAQEATVNDLKAQRERWNDATYVVTQARERLYYIRPGEVSYLVVDDRPANAMNNVTDPVSSSVTESVQDWLRSLVGSVVSVGLSPSVPSSSSGGVTPTSTPAPSPVATPTATPSESR